MWGGPVEPVAGRTMSDRNPPVESVPVPVESRVPGGRTNAYVVGVEDALLVDPAGVTRELSDAVAGRDVEHVAITHSHTDHVGAVADYAADLDATVWARAGRAEAFERATGIAPDRTFREGTVVGPTTVLETPGHASDHVAFVTPEVALVGDVAVAEGSVVIGESGDLRAYLVSLRRLRHGGFSRLYPGHGPAIDDPEATLDRLLYHRLDREATVRRAVREGAGTPDEIVDAAYEKDVSDVRELARLTVVAHLRKLAVEGDVEWDGERATPG